MKSIEWGAVSLKLVRGNLVIKGQGISLYLGTKPEGGSEYWIPNEFMPICFKTRIPPGFKIILVVPRGRSSDWTKEEDYFMARLIASDNLAVEINDFDEDHILPKAIQQW